MSWAPYSLRAPLQTQPQGATPAGPHQGPPGPLFSPRALPQHRELLRTLPHDPGGLTVALLTAPPPPGEETGARSSQGLLKGKNS